MSNLPKISIITVVYNAGKLIAPTIESVKNQTYENIEYIVVDGASVDETLDVIKEYEVNIRKWVSEPDEGVYDAMNKGISMATGDYIWFINAGDRLYTNTVLEEIFSGDLRLADVFYGETMIIDEDGHEIGMRRLKAPDSLNWHSLINGMLVCHQSFLVKRELAPLYDTGLKIAADYAWMLECLKSAQSVHNTGLILSAFLDGGLNKKNIPLSLRERFATMVKHFGFARTFLQHFIIGFRFFAFLFRNRRF